MTFANQVSKKRHKESDNTDYVMHVKYNAFHRQFFQVFIVTPGLYHLEYWLTGRHRHLLSLLNAEPFNISRMTATMGQKVVALQVGN